MTRGQNGRGTLRPSDASTAVVTIPISARPATTAADAAPPASLPAAGPHRSRHAQHDADWSTATGLARELGARVARGLGGVVVVPLDSAAGRTLAHDLFSPCELPRFSASAMDGWALGGAGTGASGGSDASRGSGSSAAAGARGPWILGTPILAGDEPAAHPLLPGWARPIATGAPVPPGTASILRSEHGEVVRLPGSPAELRLGALAPSAGPRAGEHIRPAGEEARHGDPLLRAGDVLTPPRIALAAVAGLDELAVTAQASAEILVLGDELRRSGVPSGGGIRDAFGPSLPAVLSGLGLEVAGVRFVGDEAAETVAALAATTAPLIITTGGSSRGPADHVRAALSTLGGRLVIDGVAVRPGHPVMVAELPGGRAVLCLPGNPLAALLCLVGLGVPLVDALLGRSDRPSPLRIAAAPLAGVRGSTRLVACVETDDGIEPVGWSGSGMLRGLARAESVAVVPPGGVPAGTPVRTLPLPW